MKNKSSLVILFVSLTLLVFSLTGVYGIVLHKFFPDWNGSGVFGDSFGALNSIFSGLAFSGLMTTIYLQRKQLDDQSKFNKILFLQTRYDYLLGQIKTWRDHHYFDHVSFFEEVENNWKLKGDEDFDFHLLMYYKYGNRYEHFVYIFKETVNFITNEYVPSNYYSLNQKREKEIFIEILKSKIRDEDLLLLAIHAEFMDEELQNLLEEHAFFTNLKEDTYSEYTKISEIFNHKYATWEHSGGLPI